LSTPTRCARRFCAPVFLAQTNSRAGFIEVRRLRSQIQAGFGEILRLRSRFDLRLHFRSKVGDFAFDLLLTSFADFC
jgi:hypothetical protein